MSVSRKQVRLGHMECGAEMTNTPWWTHAIGLLVMGMAMLFSYAALLENGIWPAVTGFAFGFGFLLLLYGHHFDRFYLHIGDKIKIGGDAYDPERTVEHEAERVEVEQRMRK